MENDKWMTVLKGLIVGATMIVPGVSGGTMAMILGIYDQLISAVSSFHKNIKENFLFLALFACSAGVGFYLFASPASWMLENYTKPVILFFVGVVICGIPVIGKKSGIRRVSLPVVMNIIFGAVIVAFISKIPENVFALETYSETGAGLILFAAGIVTAAALILPGISFSHFLLILGLYDRLLISVKTFELSFLLPLGAGICIGIVLFSRNLEKLMEKYPRQTYMIILGFIIGSVGEIIAAYF